MSEQKTHREKSLLEVLIERRAIEAGKAVSAHALTAEQKKTLKQMKHHPWMYWK